LLLDTHPYGPLLPGARVTSPSAPNTPQLPSQVQPAMSIAWVGDTAAHINPPASAHARACVSHRSLRRHPACRRPGSKKVVLSRIVLPLWLVEL
jgi:hypothetical protein